MCPAQRGFCSQESGSVVRHKVDLLIVSDQNVDRLFRYGIICQLDLQSFKFLLNFAINLLGFSDFPLEYRDGHPAFQFLAQGAFTPLQLGRTAALYNQSVLPRQVYGARRKLRSLCISSSQRWSVNLRHPSSRVLTHARLSQGSSFSSVRATFCRQTSALHMWYGWMDLRELLILVTAFLKSCPER